MEVIPGVFWIEGPLNVDFLKSQNVKVVIGNKATPNIPEFKNFKVVYSDVIDTDHVFKLVNTIFKLYTNNIVCALSFDKEKLLPILVATMMITWCKICNHEEIDELIYLNYKLNLTTSQKQTIKQLCEFSLQK